MRIFDDMPCLRGIYFVLSICGVVFNANWYFNVYLALFYFFFWEDQSVKQFLGPKNQEIRNFFPQKSGGYQEFFSIKSNDFIQNYK